MLNLDKYKLILLDVDGVVWRGEKSIDANVKAMRELKRLGFKLAFLTNNSTLTRREYAERISASTKLHVRGEDVINSAYAASTFLLEKYGVCKIYPVGEEGLVEELKLAGHKVHVDISLEELGGIDTVVVGLDRRFNYEKLKIASRLVRRGARFIATNLDPTLPVEDGEDPGAGAIVKAVSIASGVEPEEVIGKPNPYMIELACKIFKVCKSEVLMVGDRLETDIACSFRAGVDSVLVLTGASKVEDVAKASYKPTLILRDLSEIFERHSAK